MTRTGTNDAGFGPYFDGPTSELALFFMENGAATPTALGAAVLQVHGEDALADFAPWEPEFHAAVRELVVRSAMRQAIEAGVLVLSA